MSDPEEILSHTDTSLKFLVRYKNQPDEWVHMSEVCDSVVFFRYIASHEVESRRNHILNQLAIFKAGGGTSSAPRPQPRSIPVASSSTGVTEAPPRKIAIRSSPSAVPSGKRSTSEADNEWKDEATEPAKKRRGRPPKSASLTPASPSLATPPAAKRGPGRPRKHSVIETDSDEEEEAEASLATVRTSKPDPSRSPRTPSRGSEAPSPAKRSVGRPKKISLVPIDEAPEPAQVSTPKRGPGRPPKSPLKEKAEVPEVELPAKRRRGRPSKSSIEPSSDEVLVDEYTSDTDLEAPPPKRGRPPKRDSVVISSPVVTPKRRGRPPKSPQPEELPAKRGPGRPRKSDPDERTKPVKASPSRSQSLSEVLHAIMDKPKRGRPRKTPPPEISEEEEEVEDLAHPVKKARGRPRKTEEDIPEPAKRGRGRPRKTPPPAEEEEEQDVEGRLRPLQRSQKRKKRTFPFLQRKAEGAQGRLRHLQRSWKKRK
jgi:hypothetical protein